MHTNKKWKLCKLHFFKYNLYKNIKYFIILTMHRTFKHFHTYLSTSIQKIKILFYLMVCNMYVSTYLIYTIIYANYIKISINTHII